MIASLLAAAFVTATPSPQSSSLPTIVHITVRPLCTTLHEVVVPFASAERENNEALTRMASDEETMHRWNDGGPNARLQASRIDQEAQNVILNLAHIERLLGRSYRDTPVGRDPQLDELRSRVDNIVKLQYAVVEQADGMATRVQETMLNKQDSETIEHPRGRSRGSAPDYDEPDPGAPTPGPVLTHDVPGESATPLNFRSLLELPRSYLAQGMTRQEYAFVAPAVAAVNSCDPPPKP